MSDVTLSLPLATEVLEVLPIPLCLRDRRSRYVWVNRAFEAAFGRGREELLGLTDFDLLTHEQALVEQLRDERVFQTEKDVFFEDREGGPADLVGVTGWHLAVKGPEGHVQYSLRQWGGVPGTASGPAKIDPLEEPHTAGREAREQKLREERLLLLGQLAGPLAHQLGNPLCAIGLATANLRRMTTNLACQDLQDALDSADESVALADRIIKDLLAYSKIRAPRLREVALRDIADAALAKASPPLAVRVQCVIGEQLVLADCGQASDAIASLITNACEAMEGRGTLTLRGQANAKGVELTVGDAEANQSSSAEEPLFEPLISSKNLALGLGLTTARALMANQGGTVESETRISVEGALFRVAFRSGG